MDTGNASVEKRGLTSAASVVAMAGEKLKKSNFFFLLCLVLKSVLGPLLSIMMLREKKLPKRNAEEHDTRYKGN